MIKEQCAGFFNTPPLWTNKQFDIHQFEFPHVMFDSFLPQAIPANIRLGHQMEYVFKQLVEYSDNYKVVVYNLPVREPGRTKGEIDFILKDISRDRLIHVELTCKFYIIDPEVSEPIHRLIGPNRRDTFFDKMTKIKNVQFPLLHSEEGAHALSDIGIDHLEIDHQCCFKAQLFKPYGSGSVDIGDLNKGCVVGYWLRLDDLNTPDFENAQFYMPTKSEWVIAPNDHVYWKSHTVIMNDIKLRLLDERAPMVWLKNTKGEFEKFFVVWW